ncbi:sulfotransferase [Sneathiella sp.]|uniref:sulfotransferase n=1 Tax=Sneathiella sp. TaxID=1964365 RepID=UPI0035625A52
MALEIIGPGFGRTGTNSLRLALEQLGFRPCHHMFEVRDNPHLLADWQAAADGKPVDWHQVFQIGTQRNPLTVEPAGRNRFCDHEFPVDVRQIIGKRAFGRQIVKVHHTFLSGNRNGTAPG